MIARHSLFAMLVVTASIGAVTTASAQGLTRAQVRQQLIEAQANGSQFVTDSSYPDVSPIFAQQVAHAKAQQQQQQQQQEPSGMGAPMQGTSDSGAPRTACVGPVSFCNLYSGS